MGPIGTGDWGLGLRLDNNKHFEEFSEAAQIKFCKLNCKAFIELLVKLPFEYKDSQVNKKLKNLLCICAVAVL